MPHPHRRAPLRAIVPLAAIVSLSACISFGAKPPASLIRLAAVEQAPADAGRPIAAGRSVTVMIPHGPAQFAVPRVAVRSGDGTIAYVKDAQYADQPFRLLQDVFAQVIQARTGRPVLDGRNYHLAPGLRMTIQVDDFSVDANRHQVDLVIDVLLQSADGKTVTSRRIAGHAPVAAITAAGVAPALGQAANQVATQIADWIGR